MRASLRASSDDDGLRRGTEVHIWLHVCPFRGHSIPHLPAPHLRDMARYGIPGCLFGNLNLILPTIRYCASLLAVRAAILRL